MIYPGTVPAGGAGGVMGDKITPWKTGEAPSWTLRWELSEEKFFAVWNRFMWTHILLQTIRPPAIAWFVSQDWRN